MVLRSRHVRSLPILVVLAALLGASGSAWAQNPPVAVNCTATLVTPPGVPAVSVFLLPNGTGTPLSACWAFPGMMVSAQIQVQLNGAAGLPSPFVPQTAIRLEHVSPGGVTWCPYGLYPPPPHGPNCADSAAGATGAAQFTLAYHGGGWIFNPTFVWVNQGAAGWAQIPSPLNVHYNSADINGDGVVNLSDVAIFASFFFGPTCPYQIDFNWDGNCNLVDVGLLAASVGITCP